MLINYLLLLKVIQACHTSRDILQYKVFSIIAWYLIRDHHLIYINRKYISYLSLSIKVFSCNLLIPNFNILFFINTFLGSAYQSFLDKKQLSVTSTAFFRLLTYISSSALMGARQWIKALLLLKLFEPFVAFNESIIIAIIIFITPYFYFLFGNIPIRNELQRI